MMKVYQTDFFSHIYSQATQVGRTGYLELNVVGVLSAGETELRLEVTLHVRGGGNGSEESGVDGLLVGLSLLRSGVLLLGLLEDTFLGLLGGLVSLEVGVVDVLRDGDLGDVDNGGGGNDLVGDGSSEWDTVDLVRSSDEEKSGLELLQEDNSLASSGTGEEDEDRSWDDGGSKGVLVSGEGLLSVSDKLLSDGKSWVELWLTSSNDLHSCFFVVDTRKAHIGTLCC